MQSHQYVSIFELDQYLQNIPIKAEHTKSYCINHPQHDTNTELIIHCQCNRYQWICTMHTYILIVINTLEDMSILTLPAIQINTNDVCQYIWIFDNVHNTFLIYCTYQYRQINTSTCNIYQYLQKYNPGQCILTHDNTYHTT